MKAKGTVALGAVSAFFLLSACGGTAPSGEGPDTAAEKKAALIVAQGGLGDEAYNDLSHQGFMESAEANGVAGKAIESKDIVAQGEQIIRTAAGADYGLVADLEYSHAETLGQVAPEFPDVQFAIVNAVVEGPNVTSIVFKEHEGSYLAGVLAARETTHTDNPKINKEKRIGFIGGTRSAGIDKFLIGYIQGAQSVDEDIEVDVKYADNFGDASKGQQIANQMYADGADIIYGVAGGTGAGIIQAAQDKEHYAIGVDSDQDALAEGYVLTSMMKNSDVALSDLVEAYAKDELAGGETLNYGLADDGVGLTEMEYTKDDVDPGSLEAVEKAKEEIINGDVEVWDVTEQGYPDWA